MAFMIAPIRLYDCLARSFHPLGGPCSGVLFGLLSACQGHWERARPSAMTLLGEYRSPVSAPAAAPQPEGT
jgi:hypothetical protein